MQVDKNAYNKVKNIVLEWLREVYEKKPVVYRFTTTRRIKKYSLGISPYQRVCATKNKFLFYGDVALVYSDKDFRPNDYVNGFSPGLFYELEHYSMKCLPLSAIKKVIVFKGTEDKEYIRVFFKKHGVGVEEVKYTEKVAEKAALANALGLFLHKLFTLYSRRLVSTEKGEMPELVYYASLVVNSVTGIKNTVSKVVLKERHPRVDEEFLDNLVEQEIENTIRHFVSTYRFLTGRNPGRKIVSRIQSQLRRYIRLVKNIYRSPRGQARRRERKRKIGLSI